MSFASPLNLLWLIPALGAVTLLYMLRRPRRDIVVPSIILWRPLPQEAAQTRQLQKLTPQLLYFLQLLIAALLVLSAAQPQISRSAPQRQSWVVIIDNGVTMKARDPETQSTRFSKAQQQAARIVGEAAAQNARVSIVSTAPPRLLTTNDQDQSTLLQAVQATKPSDAATDIAGASLIAAAALHGGTAASGTSLKAVIVSDGTWSAADDAAELLKPLAFASPALIQVVDTPYEAQNIGITRFSVQRDTLQPQSTLQVFAQVAVAGESQASALFTLRAGGRTLLSREVHPTENHPALVTFTLPAPTAVSGLIASLAPSGRDDQLADNSAYAVLPAAGPSRVLLIGGSKGVDAGLERLLGLLPGVLVDETRLASLPPSGAPAGYDLYVVDNEDDNSKSEVLRQLPGNSLVFSPINPDFVASNSSDMPASSSIVDWDRSHPALRFADLMGSLLQEADAWRSVGTWHPLIVSERGIVAAVNEQGSGSARAIQFSFSPRASGFDSSPAFPIIISNAVNWLARSGASDASSAAGTPITFAPKPGGWNVTRRSSPGNQQETIGKNVCDEQSSACVADDTETAGIYSAQSGNETELFGRTAASSTVLLPQDHPLLPVYRDNGVSAPKANGRTRTAVGLIEWAAALCMITLLIEWRVACAPLRPRRKAI